MSNKEKIVKLIEKNDQMTVSQLAEELDISLSMVHRHLKALLDDETLQKIGSAPYVFYKLSEIEQVDDISIDFDIQKIINENFLFISSKGKRIDGLKGFIAWCKKRNFDIAQKANEYVQVYQKHEKIKKNGVISGNDKMKEVFGEGVCVDDVFYADFYAWEIFGKTKLGQILLYSKQSQDKKMMKEVVKDVEGVIKQLIRTKNINAIGFVPPTVKRQVQFMKMFQKYLNVTLPTVKIVKVQTEVVTPQKTLNKLEDRIENADNTIFINDNIKHKNVLLIDDAVSSGATINQIACKIKKKDLAKKVYGFAIVGSAKGFDVINEV
jgi:phosphoribosylpyrophosphate synthetase